MWCCTCLLVAWAAPLRGWLWWVAVALAGVVFLAMALNRLLLPSITGWTLGRSLVGIAVVSRDGAPVGPWRLLVRDLAHLLDTARGVHRLAVAAVGFARPYLRRPARPHRGPPRRG